MLDSLNRWLLLASNIGIVIGLALVGIQIKQDSDFAKAQLLSEGLSQTLSIVASTMGENPTVVLAKASTNPSELTLAEFHVLDALFISQVADWLKVKSLSEAGVFPSDTWRIAVEKGDYYYFGNPVGKAWWEELKSTFDPEFVEVVGPQIERFDTSLNASVYQNVMRRLPRD